MKDEHLQMLQNFMTKNEWPAHLSKQDHNYFRNMMGKAFQDKKSGLGLTNQLQLSMDGSLPPVQIPQGSHVRDP